MTNTISIGLGLLVIGFFALDHYLFDSQAGVFLGRKGIALLEYIAVWR